MIKVNYFGRLGNNMFQYALGRYLAEEMGYELSAEPLPFPGTQRKIAGYSFQGPYQVIGNQQVDIPNIINDKTNRTIVLNGNFQYYSYFVPFMDRIREWYSFPPSLCNPPNIGQDDLLIYVRLGDYCHERIRLNFEFYEAAIKLAQPRQIYIVAENKDHKFLRNFDVYNPIIVSQDPISDLAFARGFKKIILSCSTFAWWAAMLSEPEEIYFPIGDGGHWSPIYMGFPRYEIDLRVDEDRFIYLYNSAVMQYGLQNTALIPLSDARPVSHELQEFQKAATDFHKKSNAYWFKSKIPDSTALTCAGILNLLIAQRGYKSYLEIRLGNYNNSNALYIPFGTKTIVDPVHSEATHKISSDLFFESNGNTYDLIFIDGLHYAYQVYRDIFNSLKVLNPGGTIVCKHMNPSTLNEQVVPRKQSNWTGDCWKAWVRFRMEYSELDMKVIDVDPGYGIIQKGEQRLLPYMYDLGWEGLVANRIEWLNLISAEEFLKNNNITR